MTTVTRMRWAVRGVLVLGVTASTIANVLHAVDNPISQTIAAWPPLALLLTVELISRIPVHRLGLAAVRFVATATIAGIAAWVSYWHMVGVAARYGETGYAAQFLLPLSVDGLVVVASICLVELGGRRQVEQPSAPSVPDRPAAPAVPGVPSVGIVRPAPVRPTPVRAVAASSKPRRTDTVRVRPQVDLDAVRRVVGDAVPSNRDELARLVRSAGMSVSNARAGQLLRALRTEAATA